MALKNKAIKGVAWTFGEQVSIQIVSFVLQIFIARILAPQTYGLIAMLSVFMTIGQTLMNGGMASSIIRTTNPTQRDYSTIFYFNMAFSVVLYLILFFTAPLISNFYKQPDLNNVLRVYSITIIIQAFVTVQTTILTKEMNFRLQMLMRLPSLIIGGIVGIILARHGYGVWSLVYMNLISTTIWALEHWLFAEWKPALVFDTERFKYHFGYGYKLTISGIIGAVFDNIYNIVIGRWFSAADLGYYNRAFALRQLPLGNIATAMNKVTFPLFAHIKNDDVKLKEAYKRIMITVLFIVVALLCLMSLTAYPLIRLLLTEKWSPAAPFLQITCIAGIFYPLHMYNLNILEVKGRSDLFLTLEIIKRSFIVVGILVAFRFGIYGLLYNQIVMTVLAFIINTSFSGKMIQYKFFEQLKDILPVLITGCVAYFATYMIDERLYAEFHWSDIVSLLVISITFMAVYLGLSLLFKLSIINNIKYILNRK